MLIFMFVAMKRISLSSPSFSSSSSSSVQSILVLYLILNHSCFYQVQLAVVMNNSATIEENNDGNNDTYFTTDNTPTMAITQLMTATNTELFTTTTTTTTDTTMEMLSSSTDSTTKTPSSLFVTPTTITTSPTVSSTLSNKRTTSQTWFTQPPSLSYHHFKHIVPVDLNDPCQSEKESWYEHLHNHEEEEGSFEPSDPMTSELDNLASAWLRAEQSHNVVGKNQLRKAFTEMVTKVKLGFDLLQSMIVRANYLQGLVTDMIRKHLIQECYTLDLPTLIHMQIPKHTFPDTNLVDTLSVVYRTLTNQTAHLYFIWTQQQEEILSTYYRHRGQSQSYPCRRHGQQTRQQPLLSSVTKTMGPNGPSLAHTYMDKRVNARRIADDFLLVSSNLRGLMCHFKRTFHLFDLPVPTREIVQQVLSHRFSISTSCARLSLIDCQLMRNSVRIFADIEEFLRKHSDRFFVQLKPILSTHTTSVDDKSDDESGHKNHHQ